LAGIWIGKIDCSLTGFKRAEIDLMGSSGFGFEEQHDDLDSFADSKFATASANKGNGFGLGSFFLDWGRSEQIQIPS
jgi:hypothetical protein